MRLNKFIAQASGVSRRQADEFIETGRVDVNGNPAGLGTEVALSDKVKLDGKTLSLRSIQTIVLNKPVGYVSSRDGQGSKTIYDLLPEKYHHLKPVGRLDKDSSGLLLLTNDGDLANKLTHPRYKKEKVYQVTLDKNLTKNDTQKLLKGVEISDGPSKFIDLKMIGDRTYEVKISEGRNRQIRRTYDALSYNVLKLHRIHFGEYSLGKLHSGHFTEAY